MFEYVFPHCARYEDKIEQIKGISRLYAFPAIPKFNNDSKIVILDSGAFGLSISGGTMNLSYMKKLSEHYNKYARKNTLCIAPDVFLSPIQSMKNFRIWHKNNLYKNITPVLQRSVKSSINIDELKAQAEYYSQYADTVCIAFVGIKSDNLNIKAMNKLLEYMKNTLNYKWIHILGVGYDIKDIQGWKKVKNFDSMDSRSYFITKDIDAFGSFDVVENIRRILECVRNQN